MIPSRIVTAFFRTLLPFEYNDQNKSRTRFLSTTRLEVTVFPSASRVLVSPLASHRLRNAPLPLRGMEGVGSLSLIVMLSIYSNSPG